MGPFFLIEHRFLVLLARKREGVLNIALGFCDRDQCDFDGVITLTSFACVRCKELWEVSRKVHRTFAKRFILACWTFGRKNVGK